MARASAPWLDLVIVPYAGHLVEFVAIPEVGAQLRRIARCDNRSRPARE